MQRWMTGALVGLVACSAPGVDQSEPAAQDSVPEATSPPLVPSLSVQVRDDSVQFRLDITNATAAPLVLEFSSAQRADFAVEDAAGAEIWRWSAGQGFAQVLGSETLAAGETRTWDTAWEAGERNGEFTAIALLTSTSHPVTLRTAFDLEDGR
jgi:hypothetical protein